MSIFKQIQKIELIDPVEKVKTSTMGVRGQAKTTIFELVGQKHLRSLKQSTHFGLIVCWILVYLTHLSVPIAKHGIGASWWYHIGGKCHQSSC